MRLTDFKALTFDCYGTLIDWETGMTEALRPLTGRLAKPLSRNQVLEAHARHELDSRPRRRASSIATCWRSCTGGWPKSGAVSASWSECVAYGRSVRDWPAFPDSAAALQYLKKHYKLVILSNVDNESFSFSNQKLGVEFDAIYTAEDIGSYKPSLGNFEYMLKQLRTIGVKADEVLHTAESLFHDHKPANQAGLASCWIYRRRNDEGFGATMNPGAMPRYDFQFTSLAELADAHRQELRS